MNSAVKMCPVNLTVWFACKSCKLYFAKVEEFIENKKQNHFTEFQIQNTSCIVFEERTDGNFANESGSVERTPMILKEEFQLANNPQIGTGHASGTNLVNFCDGTELPLPWQTVDDPVRTNDYYSEDSEPIRNIALAKTELVNFGFQSPEECTSAAIAGPSQPRPRQKPSGLQERRPSKELQDATNTSTPFKCLNPTCGKSFKSAWHLNRHAASHSNLRPYACPHCDKTFKVSYHVKTHLRTHTGERPYKCTLDNCDKSFATSSAFATHKRGVHCVNV